MSGRMFCCCFYCCFYCFVAAAFAPLTVELLHDGPENSKRAFWRAPTLQTPPKIHEKMPTESTKSDISGGRRKNARNFGPTLRGTTLLRPHFFWVFAPALSPVVVKHLPTIIDELKGAPVSEAIYYLLVKLTPMFSFVHHVLDFVNQSHGP